MLTKLQEIVAHTRLHLAQRKQDTDRAALERAAKAHTPRGFSRTLRDSASKGTAIIAELKKASPSKGILREDFQPVQLARSFAEQGAAALSVLTDESYFQGSLRFLEMASAAVDIPILRKDFMVDSFQVVEARAAGADAILLIVAAHPDSKLRELGLCASQWELDVLCEAHTHDEIDRAIQLGFNMIGVNSRNLKTLAVDPELQAELAASLPAATLRIAESGVRTREDILRLSRAGYHAFLIGEALMLHPDPGSYLSALIGSPDQATV